MTIKIIDPKSECPKGLKRHIERRIEALQWQLELITPETEAVYKCIDFEQIKNNKEEIAMLKNKLLLLKN